MSSAELFDSCVRSKGDRAGVFEYDGESGYFYLCAIEGAHTQKILDAIHVLSAEPDFAEEDISIRWDLQEKKVGLFIRDILWAVFDESKRLKHGGGYKAGARPSLPQEVLAGFGVASQ